MRYLITYYNFICRSRHKRLNILVISIFYNHSLASITLENVMKNSKNLRAPTVNFSKLNLSNVTIDNGLHPVFEPLSVSANI